MKRPVYFYCRHRLRHPINRHVRGYVTFWLFGYHTVLFALSRHVIQHPDEFGQVVWHRTLRRTA